MPDKDISNIKVRLFQNIVLLIITVAVLLPIAFGWFSNNVSVNAGGMNIHIATDDAFKISAEAQAEDIGANGTLGSSVVPDGEEGERLIKPGSYGYFTAYVTYLSDDSYRLKLSCNVIPNDVNGYTEESAVSPETQALALVYAKTHISFFLLSINDTPVDELWINPDEGLVIPVNALEQYQGNTEYKLEFMWRWNTTVYTVQQNAQINAYINQNSADAAYMQRWFHGYDAAAASVSGRLSSWYNAADDIIGRNLAYIHYRINFSVD